MTWGNGGCLTSGAIVVPSDKWRTVLVLKKVSKSFKELDLWKGPTRWILVDLPVA
jgi:hypothetical protein